MLVYLIISNQRALLNTFCENQYLPETELQYVGWTAYVKLEKLLEPIKFKLLANHGKYYNCRNLPLVGPWVYM